MYYDLHQSNNTRNSIEIAQKLTQITTITTQIYLHNLPKTNNSHIEK